jgi:hypothetical protein
MDKQVVTYNIAGPAGELFACLVPQKKHQIAGRNINMDTLSIDDANYIFANSESFLVKKTDKAEAEKKAISKKS